MQVLNFTAIDFETANSKRGSVCAVGLAKVQGGVVVASKSWFIQPPSSVGHFEPRNISVHGIRPSDVMSAPDWRASLDRIVDFAGKDVLVAHNASFDRSVLRNACAESGFEPPELPFLCSLDLARRLLGLEENRLPHVAKALGLASFNHHDAGDDSTVCAEAVIEIARTHGLHSTELLWPTKSKSKAPAHASYASSPTLAQLPQPNPNADPAGPLYAQVVVFTGELSGLSREEAMQRVADVGGICANNITKKTTMLVIGRSDNSIGQVEISTGSGKERKALQYIAAGQKIQAVSEKQFIGWINSWGSEDGRLTPVTQPAPLTQNRPATTTESDDAPETTLLVETAISGLFKWIKGLRHEK